MPEDDAIRSEVLRYLGKYVVVVLGFVGVWLAMGSPNALVLGVVAVAAFPVCARTGPSWLSFAPLLLGLFGLAWPPLVGATLWLLLAPLVVNVAYAFVDVFRESVMNSESVVQRSIFLDLLRRTIVVLVSVALVIWQWVDQGFLWMLPLALGALLLAIERPWAASLIGITVAIVAGGTPALIFVMFCGVLAVWQVAARPPIDESLMPKPSWKRPRRRHLTNRVDRAIRTANYVGARRFLAALPESWKHSQLRRAVIDSSEGEYQSSLDLGDSLSEWTPKDRPYVQIQFARGLVGTGQHSDAETSLTNLQASALPSPISCELDLLTIDNALQQGNYAEARVGAGNFLDTRSRGSTSQRVSAAIMAADACHAMGLPSEAQAWEERGLEEWARNRFHRRLMANRRQGPIIRHLFGPRGRSFLQLVRLETAPSGADKSDREMEQFDFGSLILRMTRSSEALVTLLTHLADEVARRGQHDLALATTCRALMELDNTRYTLSAQSSRSHWSRRFAVVLSRALAEAHEAADARTQAELIEFARTQTLPSPGRDGLVLSTPPVIRVRGKARLGMPGKPERPRHVDLESAAASLAGTGAVWLSYWQAGDHLYWAVVPPAGPIHAGRIDFGPEGSASRALASLVAALPVQRQSESMTEMDVRLAQSPLLEDPDAERRLARQLGLALLPSVVHELASHHRLQLERPLPLAVAPAPALGYVPWGLLALDDEEDPTRLLDLCDWTLAPAASTAIRRPIGRADDSDSTGAPLRVVVADTIASEELPELAAARAQAQRLADEDSLTVLGGSHWTDRIATPDALAAAMRSQTEPYAALFLCHAVRGTPEEPSAGGLVLARECTDPGTPTLLTPSSLLGMAEQGIPMPTRVLLQACDTSALSDTRAGEWLTIAPAFIAAGSSEVVSTLFPLLDEEVQHDPLVGSLLDGTSLTTALRNHQRTSAIRWTHGLAAEDWQTPMHWGAFAPITAVPATSPPAKVATFASDRLTGVLHVALRRSSVDFGHRLDSVALLVAYMDSSELGDILGGGGAELTPQALLWDMGPYVLSILGRIRDRGPSTTVQVGDETYRVSNEVSTAVQQASTSVDTDGSDLEPEHVLLELLSTDSAASRVLHVMARLGRVDSGTVERAVETMLTFGISHGTLDPWLGQRRATPPSDAVRTVSSHLGLALRQPRSA